MTSTTTRKPKDRGGRLCGYCGKGGSVVRVNGIYVHVKCRHAAVAARASHTTEGR